MGYVKFRHSVTMRDIAKRSKKRLFGITQNEEVKIFQKVFDDFMEVILEEVIERGYRFDLPYGFGRWFLKAEYNPESLDILSSIKNRKRTYYNNIATMGYAYKVQWQVFDEFPNRSLYRFKKGTNISRKIGLKIKQLINDRRLPVAFQENKNLEGRKEEIKQGYRDLRMKKKTVDRTIKLR